MKRISRIGPVEKDFFLSVLRILLIRGNPWFSGPGSISKGDALELQLAPSKVQDQADT